MLYQIFMKKLFLLFFIAISTVVFASDTTKLYNPNADAAKDLANIIAQAKKQNKHVLIQAGGNWCSWCREFNRFSKADKNIDSIIKADYIVYHLNYSEENKNNKIFARYGYAQRFGFPVFIILDKNGNRLHIQNSAYLEKGKSYDNKKVFEFLENWNPASINPDTYKKDD